MKLQMLWELKELTQVLGVLYMANPWHNEIPVEDCPCTRPLKQLETLSALPSSEPYVLLCLLLHFLGTLVLEGNRLRPLTRTDCMGCLW